VLVTDFSWHNGRVQRPRYLSAIKRGFQITPVVGLIGPRQVGKTTLARQYVSRGEVSYFDLEDPADLARLDTPKLALERLRGLVVIDEVQRRPDLFPVLRVLVDRPRNPAKFLVLGSASPELLRQSSESLAGRIAYLEVAPFSAVEVGAARLKRLWLRGGLPPAFLARDDRSSALWRKGYVGSFLERDLPEFGIRIPPSALRRFWIMLAHYHGQTLNLSELGRSFGVADTTVRHYVDILSGAFVVRTLPPWHENIGKRQVKAPKLYVRDSGLLHSLLGISSFEDLHVHPKLGASWAGFALAQILALYGAEPEEEYFWGVHSQGELDLLILRGSRRLGFEIKYTGQPRVTPALRSIVNTLNLDSLEIICPGRANYQADERIAVRGLEALLSMPAAASH
jgi:hypothetical protein